MHYLYLFIAGGLGTLCRFGISRIIHTNFSSSFPVSTFLSNLLSCLILALTVLYFNEKTTLNSIVKLIVITGFCGGFSTFSTFSFETLELLKRENYVLAILNVILSVSASVSLLLFMLYKDKSI